MPTFKLVIFDVDGTLADSLPWFTRIINTVAEKYRIRCVEPHDIEMLRHLDSRQILDWFRVPRWKVPIMARHVRALKAQQIDEIKLFPGVDRLLAGLAANKVLAIVSSDTEDNVRRMLGPDNARLIAHYACRASMFGKRAKFRTVLRRSRIPAAQAIAIGDETRDAEAARAAGIAFGAVSWGYSRIDLLRTRAPDEVFLTIEDMAARLA